MRGWNTLNRGCDNAAKQLAALISVRVTSVDLLQKECRVFPNGEACLCCANCDKCAGATRKMETCDYLNLCLYGLNEAYRWGGKYVYYCPAGMIFTASSVLGENGRLSYGIVAGPIRMGIPEDFEAADDTAQSASLKLPLFSTAQVGDLAELMGTITTGISGQPHSLAGTAIYEQDKILKTLYSVSREFTGADRYPIDTERRLLELIRQKDKKGSQELLNELLGHIYYAAEYDLGIMKARALELAVVISRATIEAGADINEIFVFSESFFNEIDNLASVEDVGAWLSALLHRFIDYSFNFSAIKHSDVVFKAAEYVKRHYAEKISLDGIAAYVSLSKSYLSRVFKEETGESLTAYINRIRIDRAKLMLLDEDCSLADAAARCGFEDQSYFTKVFKRLSGSSPKRYREGRGNRSLK